MDVSKIKVGVKVKHKAFGIGTVAAIQPDMVTVRFGGVEKKFLLPAAIVQGYLKKGYNRATAEMMAREFFRYES